MGIDVFGVFQRREKDRWSFISRYYDGARGELRMWLGYGPNQYDDNYQAWQLGIIRPTPSRGLPVDLDLDEPVPDRVYTNMELTVENVIGSPPHSWLLADEILQALPALSVRTLAVPLPVYHATKDKTDDVAQWQAMTGDLCGLCGDVPDTWKLVSVRYCSEKLSHLSTEVPCECVCDFSDEIAYFTDEVRQIQDAHGEVRFVYGFS